jgi:4-amino-4-deoxy-L-arabinose transferase-like glycosyltransferase
MLGENKFNALNLTLWILAIIFHLRAFWLNGPPISFPNINLKAILTSTEWNIRITRRGLIIFGILALVMFFRLYRLDTVPPEMTSDHAEKLMDVYDIMQGRFSIFFTRNTGREPLYIYLSALVAWFTGTSFLTLKIVAVMGGLLTLPYIYLLGKEFGSERIGLLAVLFTGFGYWPSVIERFGLRISFYPLFAAPTLYYIIRGLRRENRNDFILAGVAMGLGLNGYTPFRIMPLVVVALFGVYLFHAHDMQARKQALIWLGLLAFTSWVFFIPLARYASQYPDMFLFRALSRLGTVERALPAPLWQLIPHNIWNAAKEFNWYNGNIWVHSIPGRPALDVVSGSLFLLGVVLILFRYIRSRNWMDLMLLLAVPLLQMPSILSLAFPDENPSLNRTGGALVPVFLLVAIGLDSLLNSISLRAESAERLSMSENRRAIGQRPLLAGFITLVLIIFSFSQNYNLVFKTYYEQYRANAWNSSEMGFVMRDFINKGGSVDQVWIVPFAFWVDTRLPPFEAGVPGRDIAITRENIFETTNLPGAKLFMFTLADSNTMAELQRVYPQGKLTLFKSVLPIHNFYVFRIASSP